MFASTGLFAQHPDLNGDWRGTRDTRPVGNVAKDLPGLKLPLTPAGEAAWKHNVSATIDSESLCILGGIPRHNASGLPFQILTGSTDGSIRQRFQRRNSRSATPAAS
jgi:hypothetical protein